MTGYKLEIDLNIQRGDKHLYYWCIKAITDHLNSKLSVICDGWAESPNAAFETATKTYNRLIDGII
jgi:hypothetical protein